MTVIYNLLDLDEPVYHLTGALVPADTGPVQVVVGPDAVAEYPDEFRPVLAYFTRLRTRSQALAAASGIGFDADDLAAMATAGLLWSAEPAPVDAQIAALGRLGVRTVVPPSPHQNYPGYVALTTPDGAEPLVSDLGAALLNEAAGGALGPVVARVAVEHSLDPHAVWRRLGADLAALFRTGAAVLTVEA